MPGQIGTGALSYLGYALEATKGVPAAAINDFLFVTGNNITATPDVIRKNVLAGDRSAERIIRPSKFKIAGTLTHPLYGNSGAQFIMAALGMDTYVAAVPGAAYTSGTTTNGSTKFTSSDPLTPGAWVTFGTGAAQEPRQILPQSLIDPAAGPNAWMVAALSAANQGATGTFDQPAQHKFSPIPHTNPLVYSLPSLTVEMNEGGQWAWQLPGCLVGKYNIKGGKEDVEVSNTIAGTVMPNKLPFGSFTAFNPTTSELADVARPFTINDGYVVVPGDPAASGASHLQIIDSIEDWEYDYDNGLLDKAFWDGGQVYKVYPGMQKSTIKYKYAIAAGRPDAYEDFLVQRHAVPIPFIASMALNIGTPILPSWYAYGLYVPSTIMTKADVSRSVSDVLTMNIEADALITAAGTPICSIFVMNSSTAAYVGT
jgi:hypothetical protein